MFTALKCVDIITGLSPLFFFLLDECLSIPSTILLSSWRLHRVQSFLPCSYFPAPGNQCEWRISRRNCIWARFLASLQLLCCILWYCRCRLLPLHCGRDLVLQRPRPQQLHLPLGDSSGTKGKTGICQFQNVAANKHGANFWPFGSVNFFSKQQRTGRGFTVYHPLTFFQT